MVRHLPGRTDRRGGHLWFRGIAGVATGRARCGRAWVCDSDQTVVLDFRWAAIGAVALAPVARLTWSKVLAWVGIVVMAYAVLGFTSNLPQIRLALRSADWSYLPVLIALSAGSYLTGAMQAVVLGVLMIWTGTSPDIDIQLPGVDSVAVILTPGVFYV